MTNSRYYNNRRISMLDFVPANSKAFLEIGCGTGVFGAEIIYLRNDAIVWGVEPNTEAAFQAKRRLNNVIIDIFHDELPLPQKYFDCIIFNDVLEHMSNPWNALNFSRSLLKTDESLIIGSIPNFRYWGNMKEIILQRDFMYKDSGILDRTHLRFFTKKSIFRFFSECEYDLLQIEGINEEVDWKYKFINLLSCNNFDDMRYLQFAFVAKPKIK